MTKDAQSRKWQLTINNPQEKDLINDKIKDLLESMKSIAYYCLSDEIGTKERTFHKCIYLVRSSTVRFSTIKSKFPSAHIEIARGTSQQNKDYVF